MSIVLWICFYPFLLSCSWRNYWPVFIWHSWLFWSERDALKSIPQPKRQFWTNASVFMIILKWSEIGTLIRGDFRASVISQLEITKNDNVTDYFKLHTINEFLHRKIKSLREQSGQNQFWIIFEFDFKLTGIDRSFHINEQFNKFQ